MVEPPLQSLIQSQLNWLSLLKREVEGANVTSINSGQRSSKGFQEAPKASIILDVCIYIIVNVCNFYTPFDLHIRCLIPELLIK